MLYDNHMDQDKMKLLEFDKCDDQDIEDTNKIIKNVFKFLKKCGITWKDYLRNIIEDMLDGLEYSFSFYAI